MEEQSVFSLLQVSPPVLCGRPSKSLAPHPGGALTSTHPLVVVWYPHHLVGEARKFRADNGDKDGTH